jgi:hypothetical protein
VKAAERRPSGAGAAMLGLASAWDGGAARSNAAWPWWRIAAYALGVLGAALALLAIGGGDGHSAEGGVPGAEAAVEPSRDPDATDR